MSHTSIHCVLLLLTFPGKQMLVAPLASGDIHLVPYGLSEVGLSLLDSFLARYNQVWETEDPIYGVTQGAFQIGSHQGHTGNSNYAKYREGLGKLSNWNTE